MKTTEHLLFQLETARSKDLIESVLCNRHFMPGYVSIKITFSLKTPTDTILNLRKHIEHTYEDTYAGISVYYDDACANNDALKIQMKIKAPG